MPPQPQGGFPGAPVNASIALALEEAPRHAICYERTRDAVLRFFVRHTKPFVWFAVFLIAIFIIDILVIIVFFWGAVFGVGVIDPDVVCDVNMSAVTDQGYAVCTLWPQTPPSPVVAQPAERAKHRQPCPLQADCGLSRYPRSRAPSPCRFCLPVTARHPAH
jgi:hypothetical protein